MAYPNTDIFIILFSVVDPSSFENAIKMVFYSMINNKWHTELKKDKPDVPQFFVGSKIDLREEYSKMA